MDMNEQNEIQLSLPPFRVTFVGTVEASEDEEPVSVGVEDGEPIITSTAEGLLLTVEAEGHWTNMETGESGEFGPGTYVLTSKGLYSAPGDETVPN